MTLLDRPVFILGSPRSGTSIMSQTINAHPSIFVPLWETGLFEMFDTMLKGHLAWILKEHKAGFPLELDELKQWIRESIESLILRFAQKCGKSRWGEKTPAHVFHMKLMADLFPRAQFIHMIRNGQDVVKSLQNMWWAPQRIRWSIQRWIDSVEIGRAFGKTLPSDQYREVRYEDFMADPEGTLRGLCDFLGEPFAPQMLQSHEPANNSWNYSLPPLQKGAIHNHKRLSLFNRMLFAYYAKPLMKQLGYAD